ncbi:phosphoribosylglycinamide formyltransferase [Helicobacter didelphidarum]|uniref:phosphoribosylglycinamide formyltransferase 1 n=1 Tax=Helicobacter didelphidarum TaxID=2040648 RepID=A0A3D8INM0_9HELI|nr:formyltransferase family protein [Helicobacter didelphidarum]RDU66535.1 phosphoribosylglycinamide formyltransferase [Helicobacter didelphidarum]
MQQYINIAILISGNGTNMENLIQTLHNKTLSQALHTNGIKLQNNKTLNDIDSSQSNHELPYREAFGREVLSERQNMQNIIINANNNYKDLVKNDPIINVFQVISNKSSAYGLIRAKNLHIPTYVIESKAKTREDFDYELAQHLSNLNKNHQVNYVLFAGFMRILGKKFFESLSNMTILNIHPSYLPLHKGANGIEESFYDTNDFGGVSIHYVSEELDSGTLIMQEKIQKIHNESLESFSNRIHILEYKLYPQAFLKVILQQK